MSKQRSPNPIRVAFATETRAEYGLLRPIYDALDAASRFRPVFLAGGMHHLARFGRTVELIRADRVRLIEVKTLPPSGADAPADQAKAAANAVAAYGKALADFDWLIVLGDRLEMLAAVVAATALGVPVAHVHGGDVAPAARDDSIRHAITKLAHLHFPATPAAAKRIRRLGEDLWRIHLAGAPAVDAMARLTPPPKDRLDALIGFDTSQPFALVVQHAAGFTPARERAYLKDTLLATADKLDRGVVIGPGLDPGSSQLHRAIEQFVAAPARRGRWVYFPSLPQEIYFALLARCAVLVGNSSSGIIEAACFRRPVVDVGPRQQGRQCSTNVIHCDYGREPVRRAIARALTDRTFHRRLASCRNIYGRGKAGQVVADALAHTPVDRRLLIKVISY